KDPSIMSTERQRFAFVVQFARMDFTAPRIYDLTEMQRQLRDFLLPTHASLKPGGLHLYPNKSPYPEEYTPALFQALQAEVRDVLGMILVSRGNPQAWTPKEVTVAYMVPDVPTDQGAPGRHLISIQGATRDVFLLGVGWLVSKVDTSMLAQCPECDTYFLKKQNQVYCSRACTNRVSFRQWRERQAVDIASP